MVNQKIYTVAELNQQIKNMLESNPSFYNLFVQGEISNYKAHPSGHHYMTIKDEQAAISAVLFRTDAARLRFKIENGIKVIARGRVSSFTKTGQVQLYLSDMMPDGVGLLNLQFEQLKQKLYNEGLFDEQNKKPLPKYPKNIALITSKSGAAVRDMIRIIKSRWSLADITIYPSAVQGKNAPDELINALKLANRHGKADVIIMGRGGGSIEDLWAFNDEKLAYEIFKSKIPVISAVGHEPDFTICDFVADLRAATPSNGAELAVPDGNKVKFDINSLETRLKKAQLRKNMLCDSSIQALQKRLMAYSPKTFISQKHETLDMLEIRLKKAMISEQTQLGLKYDICVEQLFKAMEKRLDKAKREFAQKCASLDALSPLKVLKRGYSVAMDKSGKVISNANELKTDDIIKLRLENGSADCQIKHIDLD